MLQFKKHSTCLLIILSLVFHWSFSSSVFAAENQYEYLDKNKTKNGPETLKVFGPVIKQALKSTLRIQCDGKDSAYGVVIDSTGLALTKASEIKGKITCLLSNGKSVSAEVVHTDKKQDIAILQLKGEKHVPIKWFEGETQTGQWVVIPGIEELPEAIGIVSGGLRRISSERGVFGVSLNSDNSILTVTKVFPGTGAAKAKIQKDDILVSLDENKLNTKRDFVKTLNSLKAGDFVDVGLRRDSKDLYVRVFIGYSTGNIFSRMNFQNQMGGYLSTRRSGFASIFSHDAILTAQQCGGVLVNLDGEAIGINIARAGRTETYALPVKVVLEVIKTYKNGLN